jgi:hypothetical protein
VCEDREHHHDRRSPHDVFAFVSDLENAPKWNYALVETRKTSEGPVRVGTTYRQIRSIPYEERRIARGH